ncbi:MAG TPA: glycosyltransferase family 2 protein [Solirubrobacteraceae bacterium]|nr:glycosyltransferase family 2 protein [Solirubrobacteraceae bacterium]
MSDGDPDISVVIPTYNRAPALRLNFPYVLGLEGIREIVVVVDGSADETGELLRGLADDRVRVITHAQRRGSQAARQTGVSAAHFEWLLMLDDDCAVFPEFARVLLDAARRCDADIVAAPWLHVGPRADPREAYATARASPSPRIGLHTSPSVFPDRDLETPFLPGNVLINRRVFEQVSYDEGLERNAWREETSFYLDACAAGFRCVMTPHTASFQLGQWEGGQRLPRLAYEFHALRNNWRFLRRYENDLRARREIRTALSGEAAFAWTRASSMVRGYVGARVRRRRRDD